MRLNERSDADMILHTVRVSSEINKKISKFKLTESDKKDLLNVDVNFEIAARSIDCEIVKTNGEISFLQNKLTRLIESKEKISNKDFSFEAFSYRDGIFTISINQQAYNDAIKKEELAKIENDKDAAERKRQAEERDLIYAEKRSYEAKKRNKKDIYMSIFYVISAIIGGYLLTNSHYSYLLAEVISVFVISNRLE